MKAVVCTRYGSPDVLQIQEVVKPVPGEDQVLVKVIAVSLNAADRYKMRGKPLAARLIAGGLLKPKNPILGADIAGVVEEVGSNVTSFQPGDEVFTATGAVTMGGLAEYALVRARIVQRKPANVSFAAVATLPMAGVTALQALRDTGAVQPGQRVLVNGASGGVGMFAVQLAKAFGAEVTAVCSTRNVDMVRSIGADHVIDYKREDFSRIGRQYDLIIDVAASRSVSDYKRALAPQGVCVFTGFSSGSMFRMLRHMIMGPLASRMGSQKFLRFVTKLYPKDMALLGELLAEGKLAPVIDRTYPLSETAAAMRYLEQEHASGKVIISVGAATN